MPDQKIEAAASVITANPGLSFVNLEQAGRAILLAFFCDIPIAMWGGPGIGKSSKVWQLAAKLKCPTDTTTQKAGDPYKVYDLRLSDKDKSDLAGIPYPVNATPGEKNTMVVEFLIARGLVPFDTDEYCILFIDEVDRTDDPGVRNAVQPVILDRKSNGHYLSPNCRIVLAGNGTSDIDTTELSRAANGRMMHLYIENESAGALESWLEWGAELVPIDPSDPDELGVQPRASEMIRSFAKTNVKVWRNHQAKNGKPAQAEIYSENAEATNRTWIYADTVIRAAKAMGFDTRDILLPLVGGCVGKGPAIELLAYAKDFGEIPFIQQVLSDPENTMVPTRPDVFYMFTFSLTDAATKDRATAEAVAIYGLRWPEEPAAFLFRRLLEKQPSVASTPAYLEWAHKRLKHTATAQYPAYKHYEDELVKVFPGAVTKPENDGWINRVEVPSKTTKTTIGKGYIIAQDRKKLHWKCACPGFIHHQKCDHMRRIPAHMRQSGDPINNI